MRDYTRIAPEPWTDHLGKTWPEPMLKSRLRFSRVPSHAALKAFVLHRDGNTCQSCGWKPGQPYREGKKNFQIVADHIVSRRNGGRHHPSNMQALCDSCNAAKVGRVDARYRAVV